MEAKMILSSEWFNVLDCGESFDGPFFMVSVTSWYHIQVLLAPDDHLEMQL